MVKVFDDGAAAVWIPIGSKGAMYRAEIRFERHLTHNHFVLKSHARAMNLRK